MSDTSQGPGWWLASDGRWYAPTARPGNVVHSYPSDGHGYNQPEVYGHQPGLAGGETNGFAIASFALSLLWFFGLGSLAATVLALVAFRKIKSSSGGERGRGLASAGLIIGICGLIGAGGLFLVLRDVSLTGIEPQGNQNPVYQPAPVTQPPLTQPPASIAQPLTTLPAPVNTQNTVNALGVTLNVANPSGIGFTEVVVQDVAYPVAIDLLSFAIASVGVCAGPGGSQTGPSTHSFVLGVTGGRVVHTSADAIPSLGPDACTDAELYFEIPPGSSPTYVGYGRYRWLVPAR